jgi:preprotein translocase YajC subunit
MKKILSRVSAIACLCAVLFAFTACVGGESNNNQWWIWLVFAGVIGLWLFMSRNQRRKRAEEAKKLMDGLKPGEKVKTVGGLVGEIADIISISPTERHVILRTGSEGNYSTVTFDVNAIGLIMKPPAPFENAPVLPSDEEVSRLLAGKPVAEPAAGEDVSVSENPFETPKAPEKESADTGAKAESAETKSDDTESAETNSAEVKRQAVKKPAPKTKDGYNKSE